MLNPFFSDYAETDQVRMVSYLEKGQMTKGRGEESTTTDQRREML